MRGCGALWAIRVRAADTCTVDCACYRRLPFFASQQRRDRLLKILREVRNRYDFALLG